MSVYRWGILGAGGIVRRWTPGARLVPGAELRAIGSRTLESAQKAAAELNIPKATDYLGVVTDPEIDICYVAVPHPFHRELAELAMNHGKHVLVEKPAAVTAADWAEMTACAKKNGVFLMEAFWTRLFPAMAELRRLFQPGELGPLKAINCAFSYYLPDFMTQSRNLRPDLAGGGLLDVGVYCLQLCDALFGGPPEELTGYAAINTDEHQFGVDEQAMLLGRWSGDRMATMACGVRTAMPDTAWLYAANASVQIPSFYKPTKLIISRGKGRETVTETIELPVKQSGEGRPDEGFCYEIAHVHDCLDRGLQQSDEVSWEVTARVLAQCDQLRRTWGLRYPFEEN